MGGDTVVCLKPQQLKTLNSQIALLIENKSICDSLAVKGNELLGLYEKNETDLRKIILNSNSIIENQNTQITNLTEINRNNKKKARNRVFYFSAGGLALGFVTALLVR